MNCAAEDGTLIGKKRLDTADEEAVDGALGGCCRPVCRLHCGEPRWFSTSLMKGASSPSQFSIGVEQSSSSSCKAESSSGAVTKETVDPREEGDRNDDPHFSTRNRSNSTSGSVGNFCDCLGVTSEPRGTGVSFSVRDPGVGLEKNRPGSTSRSAKMPDHIDFVVTAGNCLSLARETAATSQGDETP